MAWQLYSFYSQRNVEKATGLILDSVSYTKWLNMPASTTTRVSLVEFGCLIVCRLQQHTSENAYNVYFPDRIF